jgi:hypothetical protein
VEHPFEQDGYMHLLAFGFVCLGLLYFLSWSSNPFLRWISRSAMLLFGLACMGLALLCFCFPMFNRAEGSGILMLLSIFPGGIGMIVLMFWSGAQEGEEYHHMTEDEQKSFTERKFKEARDSTENSLADKEARVDGFFTGSRERSRLRQGIHEDEGLLRGLDAMHQAHKEHLERREQGLPEKDLRTRLKEAFAALKAIFLPPGRR